LAIWCQAGNVRKKAGVGQRGRAVILVGDTRQSLVALVIQGRCPFLLAGRFVGRGSGTHTHAHAVVFAVVE
jgi:hypothetical protein